MNTGVFLLAALGGGLGAVARFVVDGLIMRRSAGSFPWGIYVVNTSGSLLLGFLTGLTDSSLLAASALFVLGAGVLGGYTTFSTAMVDTVALLQRREWSGALFNSVGMLIVTGAAAFVGLLVGRAL